MIPEDFSSLIDAVLEGRADEAQFDRFQALLRADPRLIDAYTDQAHLHALLEWRAGRVRPEQARPVRRFAWAGAAAAAAMLAAMSSLFLAPNAPIEVATVLECSDESLRPGSRVKMGEGLYLGDAMLRLAFDRGVWLTVEGPAEMDVVSGMKMIIRRGRATARVEPLGQGFTLETPEARVVDLGTEFGVDVDSAGATGVAVFEGEVDVLHGGEPLRLLKGQGRMIQGGKAERLVSLERDPSLGVWNPRPYPEGVIASVSDNLARRARFYQIVRGGFGEDAPAYVDRSHEWNGIGELGLPAELQGADYVMACMDDKRTDSFQMTVKLSHPAELYVIWDDRCPPAAWLREGFEDTRLDVGLDEGPSEAKRAHLSTGRGAGKSVDTRFSVWRRKSDEAGEVRLGSMGPGAAGYAMYGVAAKGLE
ncbi:MAG TPA: FecR domain-containing protein [Planctomycetota bacterium]